jgi:hypothetical protein
MIKAKRILLVGSEAFAVRAAALLDTCDDVETVHVSRVTIELFLVKWRPDCAIINCDDFEYQGSMEREALTRFHRRVTMVLVSSTSVCQSGEPSASAVLHPAEMCRMLVPLLRSLCTENVSV